MGTWGMVMALAGLASAGCVSDEANRYYASERYAERPPEDVEVLSEAPTAAYEVIADFQARGASIKWMRGRAAKIGADAVIIGTYGGYRSRGDKWAGEDKHWDSYSRITGIAIKYKKEY